MNNMKPADELLSLRQRIKEMQAREKQIADGIKSGELSMNGEFSLVSVTARKTSRFDRKAAEKELGDLSRFDITGETLVLKVEELTNPDAA